MNRHARNTYVLVGAGALAVLVSGGVAFAFWTSSGSAEGQAGVTSAVDGLLLTPSTVSGLYPGIDPQDVPLTMQNTNDFPVTVADVEVEVTDTGASGCLVGDFVVDGSGYSGQVVAAGATVNVTPATITMTDTAANQDACKGATLTLSFNAS